MNAAPPEPQQIPVGIDPNVPSIARAYDYSLGGKDNFPIDRALVDQMEQQYPGVKEVSVHNRRTLVRLVRHMAGAGIAQFIDLGSGLPTAQNTHQVAQEVNPDARVVYIDNDPVVLAHGRALLAENGNTAVATADFLSPDEVLSTPEVKKLIDFDRPVGLMLIAVLHHIPDAADPAGMVRRYVDALPAGSMVAITSWTYTGLQVQKDITDMAREALGVGYARTPQEIRTFFGDLELVEPGLVFHALWRPDTPVDPGNLNPYEQFMMAGLGVKN
ncbi:SAM-dependent methyltransferase [Thermobifida halotolerans]|uniref:SAM-dependent methyltransferase n=2 Tax=Thermobifida halotolerans TaxID=483545 RepID=A0A399G7C5_9ACTN|nr:SAM-dependent methyltransferase [Thermobifida halotolerans]